MERCLETPPHRPPGYGAARRMALYRSLARAGEHHQQGLSALDELTLRTVRLASLCLKSWECTAQQLALTGGARRTCHCLHAAGWILDALSDVLKVNAEPAQAAVRELTDLALTHLANAALALLEWADELERDDPFEG